MLRLIFLFFSFSLLLDAKEVTYYALLDSASKHSFKLQVLKSDENIEESKLETIYSQYYPTLNLNYNTEYNHDLNGFSFGSESIGDTVITNGTKYQSSLSLNLNYEIYHFGVTNDSISIAKKELEIKKYTWCEEEAGIIYNIFMDLS